ncbi:DUF2288 domain-containing protein [Massilia yuzhufengensis]|uniref:DUF2288 domain-containing protein n=1 Tax=Massilia yuzhufengensis TaxID=1164594 RepID=A0A1I1U7E6_9BURK|nr:DUF2288 domain-containing protein [Massilia yuzhufengensis]SFD66624.1 hypothetical protein SAMN05216204_13228 [Massilia yuzhufengensis]
MKTNPDKDTELHDKINRETGRVKWSELDRHFASGSVIYVSQELDLIDVALRVAHDDKASIAKWMAAGSVAKVSDVQAATWHAADATLWASVVSPFVLVQAEKVALH